MTNDRHDRDKMSEQNCNPLGKNISTNDCENPNITNFSLSDPKVPKNDEFNGTSCSKKGQKKIREYQQRLHRLDSSEKISHEKMCWEPEGIDCLTHEAASNSGDSCSSTSESSFSIVSSTSLPDCWRAFEEDKRKQIIQSKWGGYGLHLRLWEDDNAPVVRVRERNDIELDNLEYCGLLSDRIVGACSSFLTRSPENGRYVLSKCNLTRMRLTNIDILRYHRYLQYLDLSYNCLNDLQPLGDIPYLMYLNASHNKIKNVLNFTPPWYLTYVNLSYNDITFMTDLSEFWSIVTLDMSHNAIETIGGLQNLKYLRYLNLSYNLIEIVSNLDNLFSLQELNLEFNYITSFKSEDPETGINTLPNLRTVIMGHNRLSTLEFFRGAYGLRLIDLKYNKIADLLEVSNLKSFVYVVDLRGNSCTKWPNYKDVLLFSMPSVKFVDGDEVSISEKISATTVFDPPIDLLAARTISKLVLMEQLNVQHFDDSVTPYDEFTPPLIILSGPSAVRKVVLGLRVAEKVSKMVRYCRSHTTRDISEDDDESRAYYFVKREDFNEMARRGEFLSIQELLGNSYGFHTSEIGALRRENKIGITQMDLNATIQMASRYSNVKLVLVLTKDEELHRRWINDQFHVFTWIKDSVENLLAVKFGKNVNDNSENSHSKFRFITDIVNEVVNKLELPAYSLCIRPQGTGATATDIIQQSKTFLPKTSVTRSQLEVEEKRHISFMTEDGGTSKNIEEIAQLLDPTPDDGLRVILDEHSNVVIDDEEAKRKQKRARILFRRSILEIRGNGIFDDDEFVDSLISDESLQKFPERRSVDPEHLKNMYINIVLKSRDIYIDYHRTKPGFYSLVIFTDDFKKAFNSLLDFTYELHHCQSFCKPIVPPEIEHLHRSVIPKKVRAIVKELRESLSTSKIQKKKLLRTYGMTSWSEPMPSQIGQSSEELIGTMEEQKKRSYVDSAAIKNQTTKLMGNLKKGIIP